jgi:hypothetical protein
MTERSRKALPVVVAALGFAVLLLIGLRASRRPDSPGERGPIVQETSAPIIPAAPTAETTPAPTSSAEAPPQMPEASTTRTGRLLGKVVVPPSIETYANRVYIFNREGNEGDQKLEGVDQFVFDALKPGKKAVVLMAINGELGTAYAFATILEGQDAEVTLSPPKPTFLDGQVLDEAGKEVPDLLVTWTEALPVQELYGSNLPKYRMSTGTFGGSYSLPSGRHKPGPYSHIDPTEGTLTRGVPTDDHGRFRLSLTSNQAVVQVKVLLALNKSVKEEAVLPSSGPLRLIVPAGTTAPK